MKKGKINNYIYFTLALFLENYLNKKVAISNRILNNFVSLTSYNFINIFYLNLLRIYKKNMKFLSLYNFILIFFYSLIFKDIVLLKNFLQLKFKTISFKKHKKILLIIRYMFRYISTYLIENGHILGFKLVISGKIGMAGSSKKKRWIFKNGEIKTSSKNNKLKIEVFNIWTKAGSLGSKIYLSY